MEELKEETKYFEDKLSEVFVEKGFEEALTYVKGGKRLRPLICILAAEAVGGDREKALPAAIAIELVHNASLIHDDILDENMLRRGAPTAFAKHGKKAIIIGDFLFALSCEMLARCGSRVMTLVSKAISDIAIGQYLEFSLRHAESVSEAAYFKIAELKTASSFVASAEAGAILGGGSEDDIRRLREFGRTLGIAYQIQDDIFDILGDPADETPLGLDIKNGEMTIIVVHALEHANAREKEFILETMSKGDVDADTLLKMRELFLHLGSIGYAFGLFEEFVREAKAHLSTLSESAPRRKLMLLPDIIAERLNNVAQATKG
ncbi:polyprenyl synthetase family protein [Candidatus Alkanophaga liquidiphilum]|nr:Geranylgeranyl pyrophosphate synthase [Candidatus Alkanophaga liquidiphilum]